MAMLNDPWLLDTVAKQRLESLRHEAASARQATERGKAPEPAVWREAYPGVKFRSLAAGPEMTIVLLRFERGAVAELHRHGSAQAGYVLDGRLRVTMPDHQITVAAGECYLLPPGVPHQIRAVEPTHVLDFFSPGQPGAAGSAEEAVLGRDAAASGAGEVSSRRPAPVAPAARRRPAAEVGARRRPRASGGGRDGAGRGIESAPASSEPRDAA